METIDCGYSFGHAQACGMCRRCKAERAKIDTIQPGTNAPALTAGVPQAYSDYPDAEVNFVADQEPMAVYRFDDGSVLRAKNVLMSVTRKEGAFNPDGSPVYLCVWHQSMHVTPGAGVRRK